MKQKSSLATNNVTATPTNEDIATAAYHLFVDSGYQDGHDQEHWLRAEELLKQKSKAAAKVQTSQTRSASKPQETR